MYLKIENRLKGQYYPAGIRHDLFNDILIIIGEVEECMHENLEISSFINLMYNRERMQA
jgi:hypothetical protein